MAVALAVLAVAVMARLVVGKMELQTRVVAVVEAVVQMAAHQVVAVLLQFSGDSNNGLLCRT
jgi:type IV secretory pathway VirB2 component (pilin)